MRSSGHNPWHSAARPETAAPETAARGLRAFLMYSSVPEGGIAAAVLLGTYALLGLPPSAPLVVLGFCGTLLVYQLDRLAGAAPEDAFNQPRRLAWIHSHWRYVALSSTAAALGAAVSIPFLRSQTLAAGASLGLVALLYVLPLLPGGRRLKAVWWAKPVAVAGAWAVGGALLPVIETGAIPAAAAWGLAAYRFLFILPNVLLADEADRAGDARAGLRTVATEWPPRRLRHLATAALVLAIAGAGAAPFLFGAPWLILLDGLGPVLLLAAVLRAPAHASPSAAFFYGFWIDALIAWPAVTAVAAWVLPLPT